MVYKRFYFHIIIRILLLFATCIWLSFAVQEPEKIYSLITIGGLAVIQVISLLNYINKTNRELARFFASLKDKDSSSYLHFDESKSAYGELASTLNEIAEIIGKSRIETEKSSKYFEFVLEHIPIGIITFDNVGKVKHSNKAVKLLLQTESLKSLNRLKELNHDLANTILNIKPGDQKIVKLKIKNSYLQLLIKPTIFTFEDENLKLVSIQDVKNELEENELISWQKLIRVLTHEIMNSITPISTLTLAINKCLNKEGKIANSETISNEDINDILVNTDLIEERSAGLQEFVQKYRSLTKIQAIETSKIKIQALLNNAITLFTDKITEKNIIVHTNVNPKGLEIEADKNLLEQVIINLVKNAIEAFEKNSENQLNISAFINDSNRIEIKIADNGCGIDDERIEQVFMPFFTTKEHGSGIGLSLARQIIRLHGGTISVVSIQENAELKQKGETIFTLSF